MTDTASPTPTKAKPGRKVDPVTEPMNQWKKAKLRAEKAQRAQEKVQAVHDELDNALTEERKAYEALQAALEEQRS